LELPVPETGQTETLSFNMANNIYWVESPLSGAIAIIARPSGRDWLEDEVARLKSADFTLLVSLLEEHEAVELGLESEMKIATIAGMEFRSFPIPDRDVPPVASFQQFARSLHSAVSAGKTAGVHCRAGIGRSSLLVGAVLVLSGLTPEEAWLRIEKARGVPVPDTPAQRAWLSEFARSLQDTY
jgi:protein-tyrosine phosphatase